MVIFSKKKIANGKFLKKRQILAIFFDKNLVFLAIFWRVRLVPNLDKSGPYKGLFTVYFDQHLTCFHCSSPGNPCKASEPFLCRTSSKCVPLKYVCDGTWDCEDGFDEMPEVCNAGTAVGRISGLLDLARMLDLSLNLVRQHTHIW